MNTEEIAKILTYLYVDVDQELKPEKVLLWYDLFGAYDLDTGWRAARWLLKNQCVDGIPQASDFQAALDYVNTPPDELRSADEAMALVVVFFDEVSLSDAEKMHEKLPPHVWEAMEIVGIDYMCECRNVDNIRDHFQSAYEAVCKNRKLARRKGSPADASFDSVMSVLS